MEKIKLKNWNKMYTNKFWFSFIEIIIVVMLISITTTTGMYYFQDFLQKQESNIHIQNVYHTIESLDKKVKNKEISDYTVYLKNNYYTISQNNLWVENPIVYQNNSASTGLFQLKNLDQSKVFQYTLLKNNKKIEEKNILWNQKIIFDYKNNTMKIQWKLWDDFLNILEVSHLESEENLQIINILDKNNNSSNSLIIQNIWWLKKYKDWQSWNILDTPIEIFFEYNWYENNLILE